jgi:hypothetical protein
MRLYDLADPFIVTVKVFDHLGKVGKVPEYSVFTPFKYTRLLLKSIKMTSSSTKVPGMVSVRPLLLNEILVTPVFPVFKKTYPRRAISADQILSRVSVYVAEESHDIDFESHMIPLQNGSFAVKVRVKGIFVT